MICNFALESREFKSVEISPASSRKLGLNFQIISCLSGAPYPVRPARPRPYLDFGGAPGLDIHNKNFGRFLPKSDKV